MLKIDRLEILAKENHKNFSYLSESILGKYRSFLRDVKKGTGKITDEQLLKLADCLNTTPEYLKGETDVKEKVTANGDDLSDKEMELLKVFRSLTDEEQELFLKMFSSSQK